ncbi:TetR/AcrR family transcriptional regulator [Glycomyces salinus]|uniref:TetR/AcrR family transcriptional regulator n=1 Tax=Glycomyces salinus TaxID=980294 RepID=UPI0018EC43EC|nr:TetR/AcrR family transcriptional regulator [Glycomyces salinus]
MKPSSRTQILEGALDLLREGEAVSLESAARRANLTKPGVMYHFPTKEALMLALLDWVVDCWERDLNAQLEGPLEQATPEQRTYAYLDWALSGKVDRADLVMLADPRLREPLTARWCERMHPWLDLPDDLPAADRARLTAVRLIADGAWIDEALGAYSPAADLRGPLREVAASIMEGKE